MRQRDYGALDVVSPTRADNAVLKREAARPLAAYGNCAPTIEALKLAEKIPLGYSMCTA
jgi:hypothetical protein